MPSTWAFYTKYRFGWSEATIGLSLALAGTRHGDEPGGPAAPLVPRLGERRAALIGIAIACDRLPRLRDGDDDGWMMFAWLVTWFFGAIVMPSTNALHVTHRVPPTRRASCRARSRRLYSLSSIVGPPLMTQLFGRFSSARASVRVPGAAFLAAAALAATAFLIYWSTTREPVGTGVLAGSGAAESSSGG